MAKQNKAETPVESVETPEAVKCLFNVKTRESSTMQLSLNDGVFNASCDGESWEVDISQLSADLQYTLAVHGIKQKFLDSIAGKSLTSEDRIERVQSIVDNFANGDWKTPGEGSTTPTMKIVVEAVINVLTAKGIEPDIEAIEKAAETSEGIASIKKNKAYAAEIERIRAERQKARLEAKMKAAESVDDESFNEFAITDNDDNEEETDSES